MKIRFFFLVLIILSYAQIAFCETNVLNVKAADWNFYGDGLGSSNSNESLKYSKEAIWLSTDWGESETAFFSKKNIVPGLYKAVVYVRAEEVQKGSEGVSFWHFYDAGSGTVSVFKDLFGDFAWRRVEYYINCKDRELTVWFRIKSPGQVWIKDFQIEKVDHIINETKIEAPLKNELNLVNIESLDHNKKRNIKLLYSLNKQEDGQPFKIENSTGQLLAHQFYNFVVNKMPIQDWSSFDRLEIDIFNPNNIFVPFYLSLSDDKSTNYWSQSNFKQTLAPGWNKLNFSLNQFLGERGSNRFHRSIDLSKLKKFFLIVDPDLKINLSSNLFLIKNLILSSNPMPEIPKGVFAFDFTSIKASNKSNLIKITSQSLFSQNKGYGFYEPKFWQLEDSQYTSEILRYSIGLLKGHFKINIPNGTYHISLNIDKLGFWEVPFWRNRTIYANGIPIFKEARSFVDDFVKDLLRFEDIIPDLEDNPYDLYLKKIFNPINKIVSVKDGVLDFEFEGDESSISLNSLIVWNVMNDNAGLKYQKDLDSRNKVEFDWMTRAIGLTKAQQNFTKFDVTIIKPDLWLNPGSVRTAIGESLVLNGGFGEMPFQLLQINPGKKNSIINWFVSDLRSENGKIINSNKLEISNVIYQYTSPDTNHETYLLTGKYLKPFLSNNIKLRGSRLNYLWVKLKINTSMKPGVYYGHIDFHSNDFFKEFPIKVSIKPYSLPKIDFPVGFFGVDPLPFSFYKGIGYADKRSEFRMLALREIGEAGFTTFSGLPEKISELDKLFKEAAKWNIKTVFSYGGQFPQNFIRDENKPKDFSDFDYYKKKSLELKIILQNPEWPKIVYTFSDEASGYSNSIEKDIDYAIYLKKHYPFLSLGGFGSFNDKKSKTLNSFFEYGFYSSLKNINKKSILNNHLSWGFYNRSPGNLDDPRYSFGPGLFWARTHGLSHYLEWHTSSVNNYPYYDFDGRESDVVMFYPSSKGILYPSIRFELAEQGLHFFQKLKLIESLLKINKGNQDSIKEATSYLKSLKDESVEFDSDFFYKNKSFDFEKNENIVNLILDKLTI